MRRTNARDKSKSSRKARRGSKDSKKGTKDSGQDTTVLPPADDLSQDIAARDALAATVNKELVRKHNIEHTGAMSLADPRAMDAGHIWIAPFTVEVVEEVFPRRNEVNVKFTPVAMAAILNNLANCGVFYQALVGAGLSYSQFTKLRKEHPDLEPLIDEAMDLYRQKVAHAVHSRAIHGTEKDVYYKGRVVGQIREYSDRLLELHAKRHCPEYRDKGQLDVNVSGGVLLVQQAPMSKEEWLAEQRKRNAIDGEVVK
jgi:hypothetical protein